MKYIAFGNTPTGYCMKIFISGYQIINKKSHSHTPRLHALIKTLDAKKYIKYIKYFSKKFSHNFFFVNEIIIFSNSDNDLSSQNFTNVPNKMLKT